jgi:hypothetical protein
MDIDITVATPALVHLMAEEHALGVRVTAAVAAF